MTDLNEWIKTLLAQQRPDRYEPGINDEWLDRVADQVAAKIDPAQAVRREASLVVHNLEGQATQSTNRLLRDIYNGKTLRLDWSESFHTPLAVGKSRVALRACTPEDFETFANTERRDAATEFATRNQTCEAAEWLREMMINRGWHFGREIDLT